MSDSFRRALGNELMRRLARLDEAALPRDAQKALRDRAKRLRSAGKAK